MDGLRVQVGDQTQIWNIGFAFVNAGALLGPGGHVRLRKARLHGAAGNAVDVGHRAIGGLCRGNQFAGLRDCVGDHAAHGVVSAGRAACADAKELLGLCATAHGQSQGQCCSKTDGGRARNFFQVHKNSI